MEPSVAGAVAVNGRREKRVIPQEKSRKGGAKSLSRLKRRRRITWRIMLTVHFAGRVNSSHVPKQVHGLRVGPVWRVWSYCRRQLGSKGQYCLPSISPTLQLLVSGFDPLQMCSGPAAPSLRCGQQLLWHLQTATELTKGWNNDERSARTTLEGNKVQKNNNTHLKTCHYQFIWVSTILGDGGSGPLTLESQIGLISAEMSN